MGWKLGALAVVAFASGPLLAHREVVPPLAGFGLFLLGGVLGLAALVAGLTGLSASGRGGRVGSGRAMTAVASGLAVTGTFLWLGLRSAPYPVINDVTTDTEEPPEFIETWSRDLGYPGADFAAKQRASYPDIGPLVLAEPPVVVFEQVRRVARSVPGWSLTAEDPATYRLQGVERSWLFRFRDHFVIRVRPADGGSRVDMRSRSQDGKGDVGVNAARIRGFFARLHRAGGKSRSEG